MSQIKPRVNHLTNTVYVQMTDIRGFRDLLEKAASQASQLNKTLHELDEYELEIDFSVDNEK